MDTKCSLIQLDNVYGHTCITSLMASRTKFLRNKTEYKMSKNYAHKKSLIQFDIP